MASLATLAVKAVAVGESMNARYREYLDSFPDPWEARCSLIGYARVHGAAAAARMSGAALRSVYDLLKRADTGKLRMRRLGRPPLPGSDELRIVAARLAHPGAGAMRLKREFGLPYGRVQITRIIAKYGLVPRKLRRDPVRRGAAAAKQVLYGRAFQHLAELARARGLTGSIADVGLGRRKAERAQRAVEWWAKLARGEPLPAGDGELAEKPHGEPGPSGEPGKLTSAVDVPPSPSRADPLADLRAVIEKLRLIAEEEEVRDLARLGNVLKADPGYVPYPDAGARMVQVALVEGESPIGRGIPAEQGAGVTHGPPPLPTSELRREWPRGASARVWRGRRGHLG